VLNPQLVRLGEDRAEQEPLLGSGPSLEISAPEPSHTEPSRLGSLCQAWTGGVAGAGEELYGIFSEFLDSLAEFILQSVGHGFRPLANPQFDKDIVDDMFETFQAWMRFRGSVPPFQGHLPDCRVVDDLPDDAGYHIQFRERDVVPELISTNSPRLA
jgi:hypothetical protein